MMEDEPMFDDIARGLNLQGLGTYEVCLGVLKDCNGNIEQTENTLRFALGQSVRQN